MYAILIGISGGLSEYVGCGWFGNGVSPLSSTVIWVDVSCVLHPFSVHKLDGGPIRLVTICSKYGFGTVMSEGIYIYALELCYL